MGQSASVAPGLTLIRFKHHGSAHVAAKELALVLCQPVIFCPDAFLLPGCIAGFVPQLVERERGNFAVEGLKYYSDF
jgi:hypothetical protein